MFCVSKAPATYITCVNRLEELHPSVEAKGRNTAYVFKASLVLGYTSSISNTIFPTAGHCQRGAKLTELGSGCGVSMFLSHLAHMKRSYFPKDFIPASQNLGSLCPSIWRESRGCVLSQILCNLLNECLSRYFSHSLWHPLAQTCEMLDLWSELNASGNKYCLNLVKPNCC